MDRNKNELSTFSFNELNFKKEKQKENKMPPPRVSTKHSRNSQIKELRKNLQENPQNAQQNLLLQEELNKIKLMNNNNYNNINTINMSNINNNINSNVNNSPTVINLIHNSTNNNESELADFDNGINNNSHISHNELNLEEDQLNSSTDVLKDKDKDKDKDKEKIEKDFQIKFDKYPTPRNKKEIKICFTNLMCCINSLLSSSCFKVNTKLHDDLLIFKYKLETRYNDYKNRGLDEKYFINVLNQNQDELINKISICIKDKKEDNMNVINVNNVINIHSNYSFIGKKRKKSLSEMRSITDGSSSYEDKEDDSQCN